MGGRIIKTTNSIVIVVSYRMKRRKKEGGVIIKSKFTTCIIRTSNPFGNIEDVQKIYKVSKLSKN